MFSKSNPNTWSNEKFKIFRIWNHNENIDLLEEYYNRNKNDHDFISKIAIFHRRTPKAIRFHLINLGINLELSQID